MATAMVLTGCGNSNQAPAASADAGSQPAQTQTSSDSGSGERVHITYAQWGNETETAATQKVADKFNSEQDRIEVEVVKIDHDTYVTKLNAMATAGELPDTGIMSEAGVLKFAENGLLADISSMYGEGDAKPLDALTFKYQGTPVAYSAANEVLNLWYNIDLLNEVCEKQNLDVKEMTPPASAADAWDWDTFVETAQKLTIDINGKMLWILTSIPTILIFTDVPSIPCPGSWKYGHCPTAAVTTARMVLSAPSMIPQP